MNLPTTRIKDKQLYLEGKIKIILTGGDGEYIMKHVAISERYFERNLVLQGLNQILNFNLKNITK